MADVHRNNHSVDHPNSNTDHEIINNQQFDDMRDLFEEDFADLVHTYITDSKQRIALLKTAQAADDNTSGFEAAHALKGASANLGATQVVTLSGQLQELCRERTIGQRAELIEQTAIALQQVEQEINRRLSQQ